MPKPREQRRELRREGRALAKRHITEALNRLLAVGCIDPLATQAYQAEVARFAKMLSRAPAHGRTAPPAEPYRVKPVPE